MAATKTAGYMSGEHGMGPLERGAKRYHDKDYKGALEAFNEVSPWISAHMSCVPSPAFGRKGNDEHTIQLPLSTELTSFRL
jgi:hypothetical protein